MGMWTTENQDNLELALKESGKACDLRFGTYYNMGRSYEAGYLNSTLVHYCKFLPKRIQKQLIKDMAEAAERQVDFANKSKQAELDKV